MSAWSPPRRRRCANHLRAAAVLALCTVPFAVAPYLAEAQSTMPPGAFPNEDVLSIAVAPNFTRVGLVTAVTTPITSCKGPQCAHLWVSRNGGSTWSRANAQGWDLGTVTVAVDRNGHDVLLSGGSSGLLRSDDAGTTWSKIGDAGSVTPAPSYASDARVAVAGNADYILSNGTRTAAQGSGGTLKDTSFMYSPTYPASGAHAPALLVGTDPTTGAPSVERCDVALSCQGAVAPPGASSFPPFEMVPSSGYATDGTVFLETGRGLYKSTDAGATFRPLTIVSTDGANATGTPGLAVAPGYQERGPVHTVYAGIIQAHINQANPMASNTTGGLYRSIDGGTTWANISSGTQLDSGATALAVAPTGRIFAGFITTDKGGLLCSDGNGWHASCSPIGQQAADTGSGNGSNPATTSGAHCSDSPCAADAGANSANRPTPSAQGAQTGGRNAPAATSLHAQPTSAHSKISWLVGGGIAAAVFVALGAWLAIRRRRSTVEVFDGS